MNNALMIFLCLSLSACSLNAIDESAEKVRIVKNYKQVQDCEFIADIVGTQGHWYDYLFISNKDLTLGALNSLKNEAHQVAANSVHVHSNIGFATSVTMFGQAFQCPENHHYTNKNN